MNREELNAKAVGLGADATEVEALETKADVEAFISEIQAKQEAAKAAEESAAAEAAKAQAGAEAIKIVASKDYVIAVGKSVACTAKGTLRAGQTIKARYFTVPEDFAKVVKLGVAVTKAQYLEQVAAVKAGEVRLKEAQKGNV